MSTPKVAVLTREVMDLSLFEEQLVGVDHEMEVHMPSSNGETIEACKGAEVVIAMVPMPREVIEHLESTKAVLSFGHGFDMIDHEAATEHGIMVANNAGFCTDEVANHAIMLLLACAKSLTVLHEDTRAGKWGANVWSQPLPPITGQTLGLVGFGNIARATARRALAMGMEVISYDPYAPKWTADEYRIELVPSLEELGSRSDFVSMHVPLNRETRKLAGASLFKAMKPTAYFINPCRGPTADEAALIAALQAGEIAGAGIDVFEEEPTSPDNPLLKIDNVIVTPHSAGASNISMASGTSNIGREAARILRGTWPMSLVNPDVRNKLPDRTPALNA